MSYLEYYKNNVQVSHNTDVIKGTCISMCPQEEVAMRRREKLVHILEVIGSTKMLVKCYSRSAADSNMALPHLLRPYPVLKETVHYLLLNVTKRIDVPVSVLYDFVNDRLRAVRQDMTIQRLPAEDCMMLLEPMIRFHVYFGYKLCEHSVNEFDPVLNKKYLLECIKWFLSCCNTEKTVQSVDQLSGLLSNVKLSKTSDLVCNRVLVESLYILCNLDDVHPVYRYLNLQKTMKNRPSLQLAYEIALANVGGNFVKVSRMMEELCPLTYCALCVYLPVLQRHGLLVLSHAFNSKQLTVPMSVLRQWFCFNSDMEVMEVCKYYGLKADNGSVRFNRADFCIDNVTLTPRKLLLLDGKLNMTIDNIFTYITE